jgi:threonylcarbamoyladenosine tRNA methylthiotransferase MtaB
MFTADLMVGFPGESEEDFLDTFRFVGDAGLLDAHVFAYSRREGTPAADYADQIPEDVKRERSARLIAEVRRVRDLTLDSVVERREPLPVIFETLSGGRYKGHSDSYIEVSTCSPRDIRGEDIIIIPEYHKDGIIYGKIADM